MAGMIVKYRDDGTFKNMESNSLEHSVFATKEGNKVGITKRLYDVDDDYEEMENDLFNLKIAFPDTIFIPVFYRKTN